MQYSKQFGYSRKDVILVGMGLLVAGVLLYNGLQAAGIPAIRAGNYVQIIFVLGLCIAWVASYVFRVANKVHALMQPLPCDLHWPTHLIHRCFPLKVSCLSHTPPPPPLSSRKHMQACTVVGKCCSSGIFHCMDPEELPEDNLLLDTSYPYSLKDPLARPVGKGGGGPRGGGGEWDTPGMVVRTCLHVAWAFGLDITLLQSVKTPCQNALLQFRQLSSDTMGESGSMVLTNIISHVTSVFRMLGS